MRWQWSYVFLALHHRNVDFSNVSEVLGHFRAPRAISQRVSMLSFCIMTFKIIKLLPYLHGANGLNSLGAPIPTSSHHFFTQDKTRRIRDFDPPFQMPSHVLTARLRTELESNKIFISKSIYKILTVTLWYPFMATTRLKNPENTYNR